MQRLFFGSALALVVACGASVSLGQSCHWDTGIGVPGAGPVTNPQNQRSVWALHAHNDDIYAGGNFPEMGGEVVNRIARWNGSNWSALGTGISGSTNINEVRSMASFNGQLYVGGRFENAGGVPASRIARWDGELWHPLDGGVTHTTNHPTLVGVWAMAVHDDGSGDALYLAGEFNRANGATANNIVRWNGSSFEQVGSLPGRREALAVFDGQLYASGAPFNNPIHRWDGSSWTAPPGISLTSQVHTLTTFDDGAGEALYLGAFGNVYKYDGSSLTDITANLLVGFFDQLTRLHAFDDGGGDALYAAGHFGDPNNTLPHFARWTGTDWVAYADGVGGQDQAVVIPVVAHEGKIYVGGRFDHVGGNTSNEAWSIAIWDCDSPGPCYANCNGNTTEPILTVDDFTCFINEFATAQGLPHEQQVEHYANCDGSTTMPALTVDDFTCFINEFAQGCP